MTETTGTRTAILVPVLRRPQNVRPTIERFAEATPEPHRILFLATAGDSAEIDEIRSAGADVVEVPPNRRGDYARKINTGYRETLEPFLFLGADDLAPRPGWLSAALARFEDPSIGVVGTQDLGNARVIAGLHATHSVVRRTYVDQYGTIDERGKVLHEGYPHEFVDDEFVATAQHRGAFVFEPTSIVEHLHPLWGKAPTDDLYNAHAARMRAGRTLFARRRRLWRSR